MFKSYIKSILTFSILSMFMNVSGQALTEYFMETSYSRNSINPAMRPNQGHFTFIVPLVNIYTELKTNTINLDHFTFPINGERVTFMHKDVTNEQFLKNIKDKNYLSTNTRLNILGIGFYVGDGFWNIDINTKVHADISLPKELFTLAKQGFAQDKQTIYNIENANVSGNAYAEFGVGYSRPVLNKNLIIGGRMKLLSGIADFDLNAKEISIDAGPDYWQAKSHVILKGSAPGIKAKNKIDDDGHEKFDGFDDFEFNGLGDLGFGFGFDLGAVYDVGSTLPILNGLNVSAAVTDLGFIRYKKGSTVILKSPETTVTINPKDYTIHQDGSTSLNQVFEDVMDDLEKAIDLQEMNSEGRTVALQSTIVLGAEYRMLQNRLSAGMLFSHRNGPYFNYNELTLSANLRPTSWFGASLSYSAIHSSFDTFGFAVHLAPSNGVRLFLASDYCIPHMNSDFIPTTTKALNFQLGISIPLGTKRSPL